MENYSDLNSLLIDLSNLSDQEIEETGYKLYCELFLDNERRGVRHAHDGEEIYFWEERFDHAFFAPANFHYTTEKQVVDKARVARIRWILPLISGQVPNSECWLVENKTRPAQRMYVRFSHNYIVWLEPRDAGGWKFSTAYSTEGWRVRKSYLKGAQKIWSFGQK